MRLALFLLPHTKEGRDVLDHFATSSLPGSNWNINDMVLWYGKELNLTISVGERLTSEGGTSHVNEEGLPGHEGPAARRDDGQVYEKTEGKKRISYIGRVGDTTTIVYAG
jgi:hypothetical protein